MAKDEDVRLEDLPEQGHQDRKPLDNEGNADLAGEKRKFSGEREQADNQRQQTPDRGNTEREEPVEDEGYNRADLMPGGMGKQGDQQQIQAKDREPRKDKSHDTGGSDHLHGP